MGKTRAVTATGGLWLGLTVAALALLAVGSIAGPAALLISAGILGFAASAALVPSLMRLSWSASGTVRATLLMIWFAASALLSISFIRSGLGSPEQLAGQARGTVLALFLCSAWLFAVRVPTKAGAAYKAAVAVALCEAGRVLAFGMKPGVVSLVVWGVCVAVVVATARNSDY